jgi:hypothetical protein
VAKVGPDSGGEAPTATPTPTQVVTPTATLTPTLVPTTCTPRPPVRVSTVPSGTGVLSVTVETGGGTLARIEFGAPRALTNASVSVTGGPASQSQGFTFTPPAGLTTVRFTVTALDRGLSTTVPFVVTDACGAWPTFVGGGPGAF